jgi:hypothetical protein
MSPELSRVAAFLKTLEDLRALPPNPTIHLRKHTGTVRTGRNGYTGETIVVPVRTTFPIAAIAAIPQTLIGEQDYDLTVFGDGPELLPPFPIYETSGKHAQHTGAYYLSVSCCLRRSEPTASDRNPLEPDLGDPELHLLNTGASTPPYKGRPLFWIAFELGKWLLPQSHGEVLVAPAIHQAATAAFDRAFIEAWTFN